jgi:hypothetical protein
VEETITLHVSGDQRIALFCDGEYLGMGPDRSDLRRWSFHSYEVRLAAGDHRLTAMVHSIATHMPQAQVTHRPAFLLAAEGTDLDLNTGSGAWRVGLLQGVSCSRGKSIGYHVVGPDFRIEGDPFFAETSWVEPEGIAQGAITCEGGSLSKFWRLFPSRLPEQTRTPVAETGRIRMVKDLAEEAFFTEEGSDDTTRWQELIEGKGSVTIPPRTRRTILWDLDDYQCAYPQVTLSHGREASFNIEWSESCFRPVEEGERNKGNRDEVEGRRWIGYGDTFVADGGENRIFTPLWWRAGRYVRIVIETADEALRVDRITLMDTRFPVENEGRFTCSDKALEGVIPLAVRGIQMCSHETYMDCPYYEQMMYVGDTRLQFLTACVMSSEERLNQRALELFDWSRHVTGFVLERHPSDTRQLSLTFSMIYILMLRDGAWWQRYPEFIRERIPGVRGMLEQFRALRGEDGLFTALPGWSFIDWVTDKKWQHGYAPEGNGGTSSVNNLLFLLALQSAIEIEEAYGEPHFVSSYRDWSEALAPAIREAFWDEERGLFADDPKHEYYSEHAQCLALLSGQFPELEERCFASLIAAPDLARTTVYFSFYLHEVLTKFGRVDLLQEKFEFWKELKAQGFKTPVESPEPSRSDCHAWGSHPLFSMHASLCGIRPSSPGFQSVHIRPQPGNLTELSSRLPHSDGEIAFAMKREGEGWQVELALPSGLQGTLEWKGACQPIEGTMHVALPG